MEFAEADWAVDTAANKLSASLFGLTQRGSPSSKNKQPGKSVPAIFQSSVSTQQHMNREMRVRSFHSNGSDDEKMSRKEKKHLKEKQRKWRKKHGISNANGTEYVDNLHSEVSSDRGHEHFMSKKAKRIQNTVAQKAQYSKGARKTTQYAVNGVNNGKNDCNVLEGKSNRTKKRQLKDAGQQNDSQSQSVSKKARQDNSDNRGMLKESIHTNKGAESKTFVEESGSTEAVKAKRKRNRKTNSKKNKYKHLALNSKNNQGSVSPGATASVSGIIVTSTESGCWENTEQTSMKKAAKVKQSAECKLVESLSQEIPTQMKKKKKNIKTDKDTDKLTHQVPTPVTSEQQQHRSAIKTKQSKDMTGTCGSDFSEEDFEKLDFSDFDSESDLDDELSHAKHSKFKHAQKRVPLNKKNVPENNVPVSAQKTKPSKPLSLVDKAQEKLSAARFRFLNEQLYTSTGQEALQLFEDKDAFQVYHQGYQAQVARWPLNPLDIIIQQLRNKSGCQVIADFGCGDARLAETLTNKTVHSFDLVALKPCITVCDIAKVPLGSGSVDAAVFCLSLMGTNLSDYLCEANRVLKNGGLMKVAEVVSRFDNSNSFVNKVEKTGFQLLKKTMLSKMFYLFTFRKVKGSQRKSAPLIQLKPCYYKRR